jgi:hypothetical protein
LISCANCVAGKFTDTGANSEDGCVRCGSETYSRAGAAYCTTVPAGSEVVLTDDLRTGATLCQAGKYSAADLGCLKCDVGR